jgi:endonuclease III
MKHGSEYAKRVKKLFQSLVRKYGKLPEVDQADPVEQLLLGILVECTSRQKAESVLKKIMQQMVDLNELRVTPSNELVQIMGDNFPLAQSKAQQISQALNAIRMRQETMDLSLLRQRGRREAREYLESLEGVTPAAAANVVLYSLDGHAIPVDDLTLYILRKDEIVEPAADKHTVQNFLERHINAGDSPAFAMLLNKYVMSKASRVPVEKLPELLDPSLQEASAKVSAAEEPKVETREEQTAMSSSKGSMRAEDKKKVKPSSQSGKSKSVEHPMKSADGGKTKALAKDTAARKNTPKNSKRSSSKKASAKKATTKKSPSGKKRKSKAHKK